MNGESTPSKIKIPTINERLGKSKSKSKSKQKLYLFNIKIKGYLRPSRELLEYYRKKIGDYDVERDDMIKKLDKFKSTLDDQVCLNVLLSF